MMIYANGQDIHKIIFANLQREIAVENIRIIDCGPEGFLKAFVSFLEHEGIKLNQIEKIFVVIGPGSATALRGSLSIFNTLAFAKAIELIPITKDPNEQDIDTLRRMGESGLSSYATQNVLNPIYQHEPRITLSTKDVLRRRVKEDTI